MKTVLITGTSSGIGKAAAKYFRDKGWQVAATMRKPENETELVDSKDLKKIRLDVQDKESIKAAIQETIKTFGKIDVLVNNAGYGTAGPLEASSDEQVKRQFDVNLFGLIDVIKEVLPHFRENKKGIIINISSIGGLVTFPLFSLYHSSKWAVEGLTESLQYELKSFGIKVKIVEPGGVKTDFSGRSLDMFDVSNMEEYKPVMQKLIDFYSKDDGGFANYSLPEDVAAVIYKAATDRSDKLRYLSGTDAKAVATFRKSVPNSLFFKGIKSFFKL
jgi:NAD(P)-dependent dehydrogenase (short-subunit alcohol dehydrogenase family)